MPFGGAVSWDKRDSFAGNRGARGAVDGPQRFAVVSGDGKSLYATTAIGFRLPDAGLSLAVSGSIVFSSINHGLGRDVSGDDDVGREGRASRGLWYRGRLRRGRILGAHSQGASPNRRVLHQQPRPRPDAPHRQAEPDLRNATSHRRRPSPDLPRRHPFRDRGQGFPAARAQVRHANTRAGRCSTPNASSTREKTASSRPMAPTAMPRKARSSWRFLAIGTTQARCT